MPRSRQYLTVMVVAAACVGIYLLAGRLAVATPLAQTPPPVPRVTLLTDPVPDPKEPGVLWFAPTGHTLRGSFLDYWNKHGGLPQFGYPITEEFTEPIGVAGAPIMVQYFERARFEHHPENAGTPHEVLLGALGREFHPQDPPARALASTDVFPPTRVYFTETGHNLGGVFLKYWNAHGGLAVHGYPISEEFEEKSPTDNKTYKVQYFERSRFELHPENAGSPYEVLLGQLGRQLAQKKGYFYGWFPPKGYAKDMSWIAGKVKATPPFGMTPQPCAIVYVESAGFSVDIIGPGERANTGTGLLDVGQSIVLFGHMATKDEVDKWYGSGRRGSYCFYDYRLYLVEFIQANPAW
ncbi:MAG TPA: hypothetical protein VF952_01125 [Chloroflexia bacterium]